MPQKRRSCGASPKSNSTQKGTDIIMDIIMDDLKNLKNWRDIWKAPDEHLHPLLTVTPDNCLGDIKRNVNGVNNGPPLYLIGAHKGSTGNGMKWRYRNLKASYARMHDDPLISPGSRIVDFDKIFANAKADAQNPDNYYFAQTDDYIRGIRDCGTDIVYRLGPTIEHTTGQYFAHEPEDYDKWADVCINIIRHYNHGWHNGFQWNITYWEIWNEPGNVSTMWMEPFENYCRFYTHVAKRIKNACPEIKIGGPGGSVFGNNLKLFLQAVRDSAAPLDFFSFHSYPANPGGLVEMLLPDDSWWLKDLPKSCEIHLNEWHFAPDGYFANYRLHERTANLETDPQHGPKSADGAAVTAYALCLFQDLPVDVANYYTAVGKWGLIDEYMRGYYKSSPQYNAFRFYAELLDKYPRRVAATLDTPRWRALAGMDDDGNIALLVAAFTSAAYDLQLDLRHIDIGDDIQMQASSTSAAIDIRYPSYIKDSIAGFEVKNPSEIYLITGLKKR